jgi:CRISPR-associated endonuclease/helicase Cas3
LSTSSAPPEPDVRVNPDIFQLWAKTDRDHPARWHALPYHLIEVGAVAKVMWDEVIPLSRKRHWAEQLGLGDDPDLAGRFLAFIAATHDLGKCSRVFESCAPVQLERLRRSAIREAFDAPAGDHIPHGLISTHVLPDILTERYHFEESAAFRYAVVTGGHHGVMATRANLEATALEAGRAVGGGAWDRLRHALIDWLGDAFQIPKVLPDPLRTTTLTYQDAIWLAGLISVADWIGSDDRHFCFRTEVAADPVTAHDDAAQTARAALEATGWFHAPLRIPAATFSDTIRHIPHPFPAQQRAVDTVQAMASPGIAVVEYPMGWGKTEVAFWIAAHWAERFDIPGFYVAMPTMTTSDQLHSRVHDHFRGHLPAGSDPINLQLLHGQAALSVEPEAVDDEQTEHLARQDDPEARGRRERMRAPIQRATWFTKRKRGLLATYGVGTVDQALLGILQSKHFFVRLHGLGGKTIVFDEVHSYDVYMSTLFDELIEWLAALGSPVVILTATLPRQRTQALLDAYAKGAGWRPEATEIATYPRITTLDRERARSVPVLLDRSASRTIRLRRLITGVDDDTAVWAALGTELAARLSGGGTAAVICNSVAQAQNAYLVLRRWFDEDTELELFHARFRQRERRVIQQRVLREFGKMTHDEDSTRIRPRRKVVVATQVIEQSLDLDFDLMVSMFCPTDLLLQRAGRLHRHRTTDGLRPTGLAMPELWLTGFDDRADGTPTFLRGSQVIYGEHILLRSWLALRDREAITVPDDVEALIETTYGSHPDVPDEIRDAWHRSEDRFMEDGDRDKRKAKGSHIPKLKEDHPEYGDDALLLMSYMRADQDDEPDLHPDALARTRLGPPSIATVILTADEAERFRTVMNPGPGQYVSRDDTRHLLSRSVSLSDARIVGVLKATGPPPVWKESPFLRHHGLIRLGSDNRTEVAPGLPVELHGRLGVLFGKQVAIREEEDEG